MIYFIGAGAGLMVISSVNGMAKKTMGESAFIAVAVMALAMRADALSPEFYQIRLVAVGH